MQSEYQLIGNIIKEESALFRDESVEFLLIGRDLFFIVLDALLDYHFSTGTLVYTDVISRRDMGLSVYIFTLVLLPG